MEISKMDLEVMLKREYMRGHREGHEKGEQWAYKYFNELKEEIRRLDEYIRELEENQR